MASQEADEDPNISITQPNSFFNLEVNIEWQEFTKESLKIVFENLNSSTTVESLRKSIIERLKEKKIPLFGKHLIIERDNVALSNEMLFNFINESQPIQLSAYIHESIEFRENPIDPQKSAKLLKYLKKYRKKKALEQKLIDIFNTFPGNLGQICNLYMNDIVKKFQNNELEHADLIVLNRIAILLYSFSPPSNSLYRSIYDNSSVFEYIQHSSRLFGDHNNFILDDFSRNSGVNQNRSFLDRIIFSISCNRFLSAVLTYILNSPLLSHPEVFKIAFDISCQTILVLAFVLIFGFRQALIFCFLQLVHFMFCIYVLYLRHQRLQHENAQFDVDQTREQNEEQQLHFRENNNSQASRYMTNIIKFIASFFKILTDFFTSLLPA